MLKILKKINIIKIIIYECDYDLYDEFRNSLLFSLDEEESVFIAYEKHHSTVKSVCETMQPLNIKNLILYYTEDTYINKKELNLINGMALTLFIDNINNKFN